MSSHPSVGDVRLIEFQQFSEKSPSRGTLVAAEASKSVPFPIERIFFIQGVPPGSVRGKHAHRKCKQLLVCQKGSVIVTVDDGAERRTFKLTSPAQGLYLPAMIWAEQEYSAEDSLLLVLTDQHFDEMDYLRDYDGFIAARREG